YNFKHLMDGSITTFSMAALKSLFLIQSATWGFGVVAFWIFWGTHGLISAFLGGAVCALPSFFVIALLILGRNQQASPYSIFIYEFIKVAQTILGFLCVAFFYKNLNWPAFMLTFSAVLLSHLFALARRR
ncbi:MAG: ATP synthase subunit I, partial [Burkholderiales bacterium]|nr:ATP synthase subunit I [Burkholderiales bacterium]